MASGWEAVGGVLGGGIDRAGAFEQGRLRTAQTENAILQAQERQLRNIAAETRAATEERVRRTEAEHGIDKVPLADIMGAGYGNYDQVMSGRLKGQEHGFRGTLANPEASGTDRFLAAQGVQGKVLNPFDMVGQAEYADLRNPDAGLNTTALGESLIDENVAQTAAANALAEQRQRAPAAGGAGASADPRGKPPAGYKWNPAFDPALPAGPGNLELLPITGGAADINSPRPLGMNALTQFARVLNAAGNTALDLATIVNMPSGASSGWFGKPNDKGVMSMVPGNLANQVTPAEVQQYRAIMGTLGEQLATIERTGMRGSQGLAERFNDLALLPTDDVFTKMLKLAQMRQTVENGMDTLASLNSLPQPMLDRTTLLKQRVAQAIPFTPRDVLMLQQSKDPTMTLEKMLRGHGASAGTGGPSPAVAPGATPNVRRPIPPRNAHGWELLEDADGNLAYVSPDGRQIEEVDPNAF